MNIMIISYANMKILAVEPRCLGSCHDAFSWRYSRLRQKVEHGLLEDGEPVLGDSGYPLEPWLLTPVSGHPGANTAEGPYKAAHASMRCVVERCIGVLKSRFRFLQRYRKLQYEPEQAVVIIAACAALHKICLEEALAADEDDTTDDPDNGPPLLAGYLAGTGSRMTYLRGIAMQDLSLASLAQPLRRGKHTCRWCGDSSSGSSSGNSSTTGSKPYTICQLWLQSLTVLAWRVVAATLATGSAIALC
ncbi:hypothetical protein V5799_005750 [Amblyomma americanum]|uniref:DDE Tnp4 domain-containing protein n=1 Tax=Amblyomma americanum TaxID=6943 RepID=A0AAQ4DYC9_AMBAM